MYTLKLVCMFVFDSGRLMVKMFWDSCGVAGFWVKLWVTEIKGVPGATGKDGRGPLTKRTKMSAVREAHFNFNDFCERMSTRKPPRNQLLKLFFTSFLFGIVLSLQHNLEKLWYFGPFDSKFSWYMRRLFRTVSLQVKKSWDVNRGVCSQRSRWLHVEVIPLLSTCLPMKYDLEFNVLLRFLSFYGLWFNGALLVHWECV